MPDASPEYLVGCMLPDLAGMARVRLARAPAPSDLADGIALHHASDAAFHGSKWFNRHNQDLRDALLASGVDRGASRACAHAGLEMLLDGELMRDARVAHATAIAFAALAAGGRTRDTLCALAPSLDRELWAERLGMIGGALDPHAYRSPDTVAHRLHRITSGRARIALRAEQVDGVAHVLARYQPAVTRDSMHVVGDVLADVRNDSRVVTSGVTS